MVVCMFASCKSKKKANSERSFFKVPKQRELMRSWFLRSKRADIQLSDVAKGSYVVCDLHFLPSQKFTQIYAGKVRNRIKEGEIPQPNAGEPSSSHSTDSSIVGTSSSSSSSTTSSNNIINSRSERLSRRKLKLETSTLRLQPTDESDSEGELSIPDPCQQESVQTHTQADTSDQSTSTLTSCCDCRNKVTVDVACQTYFDEELAQYPSLDHSYSEPSHQYQWTTPKPETPMKDVDLNVSFYQPPGDSGSSCTSGDSDDDEYDDEQDSVPDEKFIVYSSKLKKLFDHVCCQQCRWPSLTDVHLRYKGSNVTISGTCKDCSLRFEWCSQEKFGQKYAGNIAIVSSIILTGTTLSHMLKFANQMKLRLVSKSLYYSYQRSLVVPAIQDMFTESVTQAASHSRQQDAVNLSGDGRFDSPGHCARYCTYTFMDSHTGMATHCLSLETAGTTSATASEKLAFIQLLSSAKEDLGSKLKVVTTDGHLGIGAHMREKEKDLTHNQDVWHWVKNFSKALTKECTTISKKRLLHWLPEIKNHIWWSAASCRGDADLLVEMVRSIQYHITNQHEFPHLDKYRRCMHEPYDSTVARKALWLNKGEPAHEVLVKLLSAPRRLQSLRLLNHGMHTGCLENLHSLILTYAPKRLDFDPPGYNARVQLAVIDHNSNVGRPSAKDEDDNSKMTLYYSKDARDYRLRKVYEAKNYSFRDTIQENIFSAAALPTSRIEGNRGLTVARAAKPDLAATIAKHHSRFGSRPKD